MGFEQVGLTSDEARSWDTTRVNNFVNRYAEPPVNATLQKVDWEDKTYLIIGVPEFPDLPHICRKSYNDILSAPTLYIRTDNNESAPISRTSDLNALIERAVRKRGDAIVDTVRHVLSVGLTEPEPSAAKQFESQIEDALARFAEQSKFAGKFDGWREMVAFPDTFQPGRVGTEAILNALKYAEEDFRGWPFLCMGRHNQPYRIADGYELHFTGAVDERQYEDFWQLRDTALFFHRRLMIEETATPDRWVSEVLEAKGAISFMNIPGTLYYVTEGIRCISRVYEALEIEDDPITLRFRITGTERRILLPRNPVATVGEWTCRISSVDIARTEPLGVWRASTAQLAAEIATKIFKMFNWTDPPINQLREEATKLLERRIQ